MWINTKLNHVTANDTIVLANNRQVLAFKKTWQQQKGTSQLPNIFSWQQYLQNTWRSINPNASKRLISAVESRVLVSQSMQTLGQVLDNRLLDEVVKNINYCHAHRINLAQLSQSHVGNSALFAKWAAHYRQYKFKHNLLDANDLVTEIMNAKADIAKPIIYGFKTLTPQQLGLFEHIGYQTLSAQQSNTASKNLSFKTTDEEILRAAQWAKALHQAEPKKHIVIVSPTLSSTHYQIKSIFDAVFDDTLIETGQKAYNISLGLPLTKYPLIQHILLILQLTQQLNRNRINTETFNAVITSPYIMGATTERYARALLVNRVLSLSVTHFKLVRIDECLSHTPQLKKIIDTILSNTSSERQSHEKWLLDFNTRLQIWGLTTDRTLDSGEYQLFNKYQQTSLGLNQLAQMRAKVSGATAIVDLQNWLSQVIFQAQSGVTPIQILGSLEAEGLYFDHAWVLGMSDDFLPAGLNSPRFIPSNIASEHQIPHSSFALITKDAANTLNNLINLAPEVICSYAVTHLQGEQHASPLLAFTNEVMPPPQQHQSAAIESLADEQSMPVENTQVRGGVGILKDQMACSFKGFTHRFSTPHFDAPHIGLSRMQQGDIIHQVLEKIYQQIPSHAELVDYPESELADLINVHIKQTLSRYPHSGFTQIEQKRLSQLMQQFITTEKQRDGFTVVATEQVLEANISGLRFNTRLDRIDELDNGERIIFDYKTGNIPSNPWCGKSIKEPQLPIYAVNNDAHGVAFIQLTADKVTYTGLSKDPDSLPSKTKQQRSCEVWEIQLKHWQQQLEHASLGYQRGKAAVLPTTGACTYCEYDSLCRIQK